MTSSKDTITPPGSYLLRLRQALYRGQLRGGRWGLVHLDPSAIQPQVDVDNPGRYPRLLSVVVPWLPRIPKTRILELDHKIRNFGSPGSNAQQRVGKVEKNTCNKFSSFCKSMSVQESRHLLDSCNPIVSPEESSFDDKALARNWQQRMIKLCAKALLTLSANGSTESVGFRGHHQVLKS